MFGWQQQKQEDGGRDCQGQHCQMEEKGGGGGNKEASGAVKSDTANAMTYDDRLPSNAESLHNGMLLLSISMFDRHPCVYLETFWLHCASIALLASVCLPRHLRQLRVKKGWS